MDVSLIFHTFSPDSDGSCYVYCHTITHEIRGSTPSDYVTNEAADAERKRKVGGCFRF